MLSVLVLLLVFSTGYDLCKRDSAIEPNPLLTAFSIYKNGQALFKISNENTQAIRCLCGIRVLSAFWIMFFHRFYMEAMNPNKNPVDLLAGLHRWYAWIFQEGHFAVDTFLLMGGFLVTTSLLRDLEKGQFSYPKFLLHRYLRYGPIVAAATLFVFPCLKLANEHLFENEKQNCAARWWTNLLMINNYSGPHTKICILHFWYLAADFQLYAVSPLLVLLLWKFSWKAFGAIPALIAASSIYVAHVCFRNGTSDLVDHARLTYFSTHARIGPWIIGIMLGYILFRLRDVQYQISKKLNFLLWSLSLSCLILTIHFSLSLVRLGYHVEQLDNSIFMGVRRQFWALGVAWIIFACQKLETGGFIRWLLCLNFWQPIAKLTLSIYVIHGTYALLLVIQREDIIDLDVTSIVSFLYCKL